jgi:hypothetical protein
MPVATELPLGCGDYQQMSQTDLRPEKQGRSRNHLAVRILSTILHEILGCVAQRISCKAEVVPTWSGQL